MKIIPEKTYKLYSSLPVSELEFTFSDFFESEFYNIFWNKNTGHSTSPLRTFEASTSHTFSFLSYKPKIKGELRRIAEDKTEILIIVRMDKKTKVLFIVWLCIMLFFVVPSLPIVIMEFVYKESQIWTMIPILLFVIGYIAVSFTFYRKVNE